MQSFRVVRNRTLGLAGVVGLLVVSQAIGATTVGFTLEAGGNNNAAAYKAGSPALFTQGTTSDGQVFPSGQPVTWGVRLSASGTHTGSISTNGVANFVFDLELHSGTENGPLVNTAQFHSTVNDGNNGDVLAAAAFAMSFNLASLGPGRVVDPQSGVVGLKGGPLCGGVDNSADKLRSATYPTAEPGKLVGMGAGYNAWKACCGSVKTTAGIGMDGAIPAGTGLGSSLTICEGQISNLAPGTYVLKVVPAAGNNVLRGDVALTSDQNSFAVAADTTVGDTLTFVVQNIAPPGPATNPVPADSATSVATNQVLSWTADAGATSHDVYFGTAPNPPFIGNQAGTSYNPGALAENTTYYWKVVEKNAGGSSTASVWSFTTIVPPPPIISVVAWRSVRTHSGNIPYAITLNKASTAASTGAAVTSETRTGGIRRIEIDLDQPGIWVGDPEITDNLGNPYTGTLDAVDADTLSIDFAASLPDGRCYTIDLDGVVWDSFDFNKPIGGDTDVKVRNLFGDASPTSTQGTVALGDALYIKSRIAAGATAAAEPWADVNLSGGVINLGDALAVKSRVGQSACP